MIYEFDLGTAGAKLGRIKKESETFIDIFECDTGTLIRIPKYHLVEKIKRPDLV